MKNFEYKEICLDLLSNLSKRQKSILSRRFALDQEAKETLASIGQDFNICRERVRQIEQTSLNKVRKKSKQHSEVFSTFIDYLKNFGGLKKETILLKELGKDNQKELFFLLTIRNDLKRKKENNDFYAFWVLDNDYYLQAQDSIKSIIKVLEKTKKLMSFQELEKLTSKEAKALESYLEISKRIQSNEKGLYGLSYWPEISPKGIKDKAYLTLKEIGEPLHFSKVSELIKGSNVQTVHNELIKNDKFILIGRGMYALAEWGYYPGKVKDVIARTLEEAGKPLAKEKILEKVSEKRIVKRNTILLNLGDSEKFEKDDSGKYNIRSV